MAKTKGSKKHHGGFGVERAVRGVILLAKPRTLEEVSRVLSLEGVSGGGGLPSACVGEGPSSGPKRPDG